MAYVTREYYAGTFLGSPVEESSFHRLAMIASDVIDELVMRPITEEVDREQLAKAAAYQIEYLLAQGGIDAITGRAASQLAVTEKLDDYSISESQRDEAEKNALSINGIPVSPLTVSILRKLGLMSRWIYAGRRPPHGI